MNEALPKVIRIWALSLDYWYLKLNTHIWKTYFLYFGSLCMKCWLCWDPCLSVDRGFFTRLLSEETLFFPMSHNFSCLPNFCLSFGFIMIMKCSQDRASHLNFRAWMDKLLAISRKGKLALRIGLARREEEIVKLNRHQLSIINNGVMSF